MTKPLARIALSGLAGLDNPESGVGVARCLRGAFGDQVELHGLVYDPYSGGAFIPGLFDHLHVMPFVTQGAYVYGQRLQELAEDFDLDLIIPCLDLEIPMLQALAPTLKELGIEALIPNPAQLAQTVKTALPDFCWRAGLATPRTLRLSDPLSTPRLADEMGYPLFVKNGVAGAEEVYSAQDASQAAAQMARQWDGTVLLQQKVQGEDYVAALLFDDDGAEVARQTLRKQSRSSKGKGAVAMAVNDPVFNKAIDAVVEALDWRGPMELEFVRDQQAGTFKLIEINCRFPAWLGFDAEGANNLPAKLLELVKPGCAKHRLEAGAQRPMGYVRHITETLVDVAALQRLRHHGHLALPKPSTPEKTQPEQGWIVGLAGISATHDIQAGPVTAESLKLSTAVRTLIGLGYGIHDSGLHKVGLFDHLSCLSIPLKKQDLLQDVLRTKDRFGLDVMMPSLDVEIPHFIELADDLAAAGIATLLPGKAAFDKRHKAQLSSSADQALGETSPIRGARTFDLADDDDLDKAMEALGFPFYLKSSLTGAVLVHNRSHAKATFKQQNRTKGPYSLMAQEAVVGEEYALTGVCDRQSTLHGSLFIKKVLRSEDGKTWGAIGLPAPAVEAAVQTLLKAIDWVGPFEVEFIRDSLTDRYVLFELNPRFPAWIHYATGLGINLPEQAVRLAMGQEVSPLGLTAVASQVYLRNRWDLPLNSRALATFAMMKGGSHA